MYKENFIAAIQIGGKTLREHGHDVHIPFNNEYTVYLKNQDSRKALVNVSIDGKCAISNLIVKGNSSAVIERFFEDSLSSGHKLKFIKKSNQISEYRGDFPEDGIVRIEWQFEKYEPVIQEIQNYYRDNRYYVWNDSSNIGTSCTTTSSHGPDNYVSNCSLSCENVSVQANAQVHDSGITVNGGYSNQKFKYSNIKKLDENKYVMCLYLKGYDLKGNEISEPIISRSDLKCSICGTLNKSSSKFCSECGNCLI